MKYMITILLLGMLGGCGTGAGSANGSKVGKAETPKDSAGLLIDTAQLQKDMSSVLNGIASGKPDTAALKKAMVDFGSTSQKILSDSGIDALYGNSTDPAVRSAAAAVKRLRNASGLTPDKLDSLKKAMDVLKAN